MTHSNTPQPDQFAETIELTPVVQASDELEQLESPHSQTDSPRPENRIEIVESSSDFEDETRGLLRVRLKAVALILGIGALMFTIQRVLIPPGTAGPENHFGFLISIGVVFAIAQAIIVSVLSRKRELSMASLRRFEWAIFGISIFIFSINHYFIMTWCIEAGDEKIRQFGKQAGTVDQTEIGLNLVHVSASFISSIKISIFQICAIMILYGLFIPAKWKRTAQFVALFILSGVITQIAVLLQSIGKTALVREISSAEQVSTNLLMLMLGALISFYGSSVNIALRSDPYDAGGLGVYVLKKRLGGGGMGEVYLAEHQLLKRPCAIKLIQPERAGDAAALRQFEREVRTTAGLTHWNTIEIYDYGCTADGTFYYVMEYLRGLSLEEILRRHGPLPAGRVVYLLQQACDSLSEAHAEGLVHRDIKPANLFVTTQGGQYDITKVLDFGLVKSRELKLIASERVIAGTPLFMSPEQAVGDPNLGPSSDLYSLGAVAYTLLAGRTPHQGESVTKVINAVVRNPVAPLQLIHPTLPDDLVQIVMQALEKDPAKRPPSAAAMSQALGNCQCRADWSAIDAESWWRSIEPDAIRSVDTTRSDSDASGAR